MAAKLRRRLALEPGTYQRCVGVLTAVPRDPRLAGIPLPIQWREPPADASIDNEARSMTA